MAIYQARETFFVGRRTIQRREIVSSDDPVVVGRAHLFDLLTEPVIEQATAAPGEKRFIPKGKK